MNLEVRVFNTLETLSHEAANLFILQAQRSIAERDHFLAALNGGSTPARLFHLLAADHIDEVDWGKIHLFWGDERCVPPEDPGSNYGQARDAMLSRVPIPDSNIHRIKGELAPDEASRDYSLALKDFASAPLDWPRFDIVYLGMGEDGHTASLFPGSPVGMPEATMPVTANYRDRPAARVTLTPIVFNSARMIVFMAAGEKKAAPLAEVISGRYDPERYPAQRIEPNDGQLIWLVDEGAAGKLPRELKTRF